MRTNYNIRAALFSAEVVFADDEIYQTAKTFISGLKKREIKTAIYKAKENSEEYTGLFDAVIYEGEEDYLKCLTDAAQKVGIHPFNCVVFDNSSEWIDAAKEINMKTCSVVNSKTQAEECIDNYAEIDIEIFLESGKRRFFETEPFALKERAMSVKGINHAESLFALGNGYMGMRGVYDETDTLTEEKEIPGMYINEVFEKQAFKHLWDCKGFARAEQFTVNLTDWRFISVFIDGEKACLSNGKMTEHLRVLDMENGCVKREFVWEGKNKKRIRVKSMRMLNMQRVHSGEISYSVEPLNFDGEIELVSEVKTINNTNGICATQKGESGVRDGIRYVTLKTPVTKISVAMACGHKVDGEIISEYEKETENGFCYGVKVKAEKNKEVCLEKYVSFFTSNDKVSDIVECAKNDVQKNISDGFLTLFNEQSDFWKKHWEKGNVIIGGNKNDDFAVRFNLFHLRQQIPSEGAKSVGATGLTGYSYSGKIFWDSEMYIMPYINYINPADTLEMLMYRYKILDKARERAKELDGKGALYSWCSIDGEETSVVFEASTAEYHIECDIAYAINRYYRSTGDKEFLYKYGAEILFETARFMFDRGMYIEENDNRFCLNAVCGPDEYACGVNNNFYTNMMLKFHFEFAAEVYYMMKKDENLKDIEEKTAITETEIEDWKKAAENMYYRYNEKHNIFEQDDSFVTNDKVDMDKIPKNYDIRLIMHPLDLWRKQVLKQADVVMLMFVRGEDYSLEEKKSNYEYYEPKTNHGSSLSPALHSIIANETGKYSEAYDYFRSAAYMDLCDLKKNASSGIHMACLGGAWMSVVNGFLGMRDYNDKLIFNPAIPDKWESCEIIFTYRGSEIKIKAEKEKTEFVLLGGNSVEFECAGKNYVLKDTVIV